MAANYVAKAGSKRTRGTVGTTAEPGGAAWKRSLWRRLASWYAEHARALPWRETHDPYRIWVSETMLQQTQVATVIPYYARFLKAFPTVERLAASDEHEVLRLWEGLGYYRRARQMHAAAKIVAQEYAGRFPDQFEQVLKLPGIGRYTAGAILSFSFDQRQPILEANTIRVYSRLSAYRDDPRSTEGQRWLWQCAEDWLPPTNPGTFNQAMMELGSTVCLPRDPQCDVCPVARLCPTRALGLQASIPLAPERTATESVVEAFVVIRHRGRVLMMKRDQTRRWAGMWDFPRFELASAQQSGDAVCELLRERLGLSIAEPCHIATLKHGVTRFRITLLCFDTTLASNAAKRPLPSSATMTAAGYSESRWCDPQELDELALSVTARKLAWLIAPEK